MKPAIEVNHLTKEYRLGALRSLRQAATDAGRKLLGQPVPQRERFLALDDVSFTVQPGEVVGVIGHNGAGKSTLLKMISRITTPTSGSVTVNGRIAPLIEVGAGFVGDMTGRENVYLNGAILGLKKRDIDHKFDEIVAFAEMERFIDTPVKRYSSGMQVKLAFAVATSIESEILIVDEVLAVGDLAFQRKCFDRMEDLIKRRGRTVLLVSHNIRLVERIANHVIMLDHGKVTTSGNPAEVCTRFLEYSDTKIQSDAISRLSPGQRRSIQTSGEITLNAVRILDSRGASIDRLEYQSEMTIEIELEASSVLQDVALGLGVHTPDMTFVSNDDSSITHPHVIDLPKGRSIVRYHVTKLPLFPGVYAVRLGIAPNSTDRPVLYGENLASFHVLSPIRMYSRTLNQGFFSLDGAWTVINSEPNVHFYDHRSDLSQQTETGEA